MKVMQKDRDEKPLRGKMKTTSDFDIHGREIHFNLNWSSYAVNYTLYEVLNIHEPVVHHFVQFRILFFKGCYC